MVARRTVAKTAIVVNRFRAKKIRNTLLDVRHLGEHDERQSTRHGLNSGHDLRTDRGTNTLHISANVD